MTGMTGPWKEALPGVDAGRSGGGQQGTGDIAPSAVGSQCSWGGQRPCQPQTCFVRC